MEDELRKTEWSEPIPTGTHGEGKPRIRRTVICGGKVLDDHVHEVQYYKTDGTGSVCLVTTYQHETDGETRSFALLDEDDIKPLNEGREVLKRGIETYKLVKGSARINVCG